MPDHILIIDDKQSIVEILETYLGDEGYATSSAVTGAQALEKLEHDDYELVLCDVRLPDIDGMEILKKINGASARGPAVIMITAYGSIENAIECMKLGAADYVTKPFNLQEIREVVKKGLERVHLVRENEKMRAELERRYDFSGIIGKSKQMQDVFDRIRRVAPSNASVLITGETGVGKELVARALHYNSQRSRKGLVALNCAAIPENLLESELFGHVKGAYTGAFTNKRGIFEEADGGTLLLDEISELQLSLQAKLLRTLDDGTVRRVGDSHNIPVDTRLICSTNKDLSEQVKQNLFRLDLYHRIKVVEIYIPPLRERREDIILLAEHFLTKLCKEHSRDITRFTPDAINLLLEHKWVGNVRELINVIEQATLLTEGDAITAEQLAALRVKPGDALAADVFFTDDSLKKMMDRVEKEIIIRALRETGGNRKEASKRLALSERALYYKLDEHELK
ncbi:MAG: sigma-54 dependent transcriptional regulator [bacterium]